MDLLLLSWVIKGPFRHSLASVSSLIYRSSVKGSENQDQEKANPLGLESMVLVPDFMSLLFQPRHGTSLFELWCWRRFLRVSWTARRSNHSIFKEINPEYSLEVLMLKLKLQYFITRCEKLTHWKRLWLEEWGQEKKGATEDEIVRWHHQLNNMRLSKLWEMVKGRWAWHAAVRGSQRVTQNWVTEQRYCA